jgi:hypothetical protein
MNENKLVNTCGKGPVIKTRCGKFQVSMWHWKKSIPAPKQHQDLFAEREVDVHRVCIRYSQWKRYTQAWQESSIWCGIDDLRSLIQALDQLNTIEEEVQTK